MANVIPEYEQKAERIKVIYQAIKHEESTLRNLRHHLTMFRTRETQRWNGKYLETYIGFYFKVNGENHFTDELILSDNFYTNLIEDLIKSTNERISSYREQLKKLVTNEEENNR